MNTLKYMVKNKSFNGFLLYKLNSIPNEYLLWSILLTFINYFRCLSYKEMTSGNSPRKMFSYNN